MGINRNSPIPLYKQLAYHLQDQIENGELSFGDMLAPEGELASYYQVSRITVRSALEILAKSGLISRQPGKGTYVEQHKIEEKVQSLKGFAELMVAMYPEQVMEVIQFGTVPASPKVSQALQISRGDQVVCIKRRNLLGSEPIAYAVIYLPAHLGSIFTVEEISTTPIYNLLSQKADIVIKHAHQTISAITASQELASHLEVESGSPILAIERVTYTSDELPIEYILLNYRGERHELVMDLYREEDETIIRTAVSLV